MKLITKAFIYNDPAPTPECHASTVVALEGGDAIAAWFGGTRENSPDVLIWYSRREGGIWSEPKSIPGQQPIQHWNPVLFQAPDGTVYLFYKVGTPIPQWKTMFVRSHDLGKTWTAPEELVENDVSGGRGPNKFDCSGFVQYIGVGSGDPGSPGQCDLHLAEIGAAKENVDDRHNDVVGQALGDGGECTADDGTDSQRHGVALYGKLTEFIQPRGFLDFLFLFAIKQLSFI